MKFKRQNGMRTGLAVAMVFVLSGCIGAPPRTSAELLPGCYSRRDELRYNTMVVQLNPDGTYLAEVQGDIGLWASAEGRWSAYAGGVLLAPGKNVHGEPLPGHFEVERTPFSIALRVPRGAAAIRSVLCRLHDATKSRGWVLRCRKTIGGIDVSARAPFRYSA